MSLEEQIRIASASYKGYLWVMRKYHPKESRRTFQQWLRMYQ
jgi:hypothetical protein